MRTRSPRARAAVGLGALSTAIAAAGGATAAAQEAAPAQAAPAPAPAAAPAPSATASQSRAKPRLKVTTRRLNVRAGRKARVSGRLLPARKGRTVRLQRLGAKGWKTIAKDRTSSTGRYVLREKTSRVDRAKVRVRFSGDRTVKPGKRRLGRLNVYRPALASWYGPGLYGNPLGCGGTLHPGTVGVAHKSLPCGTKLTLRKGDNIVKARVIDRGPYVGAREFDLTQATKQRLGFSGTGTVDVAH